MLAPAWKPTEIATSERKQASGGAQAPTLNYAAALQAKGGGMESMSGGYVSCGVIPRPGV